MALTYPSRCPGNGGSSPLVRPRLGLNPGSAGGNRVGFATQVLAGASGIVDQASICIGCRMVLAELGACGGDRIGAVGTSVVGIAEADPSANPLVQISRIISV